MMIRVARKSEGGSTVGRGKRSGRPCLWLLPWVLMAFLAPFALTGAAGRGEAALPCAIAGTALLLGAICHGKYRKAKSQNRRDRLWRSRYERLLTAAGEILIVFDFKAEKVWTSANFQDVFGVEADFWRLLSPEGIHPEDLSEIKRTSERPASFDGEIRLKTGRGTYRWFHVTAQSWKEEETDGMLGRLTDIDCRKGELEALRYRSQRDGATGLYSKETTERLVSRSLAEHPSGLKALMLADIDDLKAVNDTYGHREGDRAIQACAEVLRAQLADAGVVGRVGGDEFMAFLPSVPNAEWAWERFGTLVQGLNCQAIGTNPEHTFRASVGMALADGRTTFERLYQEADRALYEEKRARKGGPAADGGVRNGADPAGGPEGLGV